MARPISPVEQIPALRLIPNLLVFRPADAVETAEAWDCALSQEKRPSVLCLTRQALPAVRGDCGENLTARGAYVLREAKRRREVTLIATGSEVPLALAACDNWRRRGSPPRWSLPPVSSCSPSSLLLIAPPFWAPAPRIGHRGRRWRATGFAGWAIRDASSA